MQHTGISIFSDLLIRVSSNSVVKFRDFARNRDLQALGQEIIDFDKRIFCLKMNISDRLHLLVGQQSDLKRQNLLINFRRDFFNDRIREKDFSKLYEIDSSFEKDVLKYLEYKADYSVRISFAESEYRRNLSSSRKALKEMAEEGDFQKALLLSSQSLFNAYLKYYNTDSIQYNKKFFSTERSILKYITRMYTKTSPFSSFTSVGLYNTKLASTKARESRSNSFVRINNYILKFLWDLLLSNNDFCSRLSVRLNPTLEKGKGIYSYLVSNHKAESFQKLSINPVLDFINGHLEQNSVVSLDELFSHLSENVDARPELIRNYIFKLISYGFLEYETGVSGMDPEWHIKFNDFLRDARFNNVKVVSDVIKIVETLTKGIHQFQKSTDVLERASVLNETYSTFKEKSESLLADSALQTAAASFSSHNESEFVLKPTPSFVFKTENIFYEDTSRKITGKLDSEWLTTKVSHLNDVLEELSLFDFTFLQRRKLVRYFQAKYQNSVNIEFLRFYEDYCKDLKINKESSFFSDDEILVNSKRQFIESLSGEFDKKVDTEACVDITIKTITDINSGLERSPSCKSSSKALFCQIVANKTSPKIVVNSLTTGFGRMLSRFLHLFDYTITEKIRAFNESLAADAIFVENCDGSYFNGNIHPLLMTFEIKVPNSNNIADLSNQIPIKDLQLRIIDEDLALVHKQTGRRTYMFDLGFQGRGRSQLFQLLNYFTLPQNILLNPIIQAFEKSVLKTHGVASFDDSKQIIKVPRLTLEGAIIIQRKKWIIPVEMIPQKKKNEDFDYYVRLNRWLIENSIDHEVFIVLKTNRFAKDEINEKGKKAGQDDYKPQYINFSNPLLVELFSDMISKPFKYLKIEEMVPNFDELQLVSGEEYISEFIANWSNN